MIIGLVKDVSTWMVPKGNGTVVASHTWDHVVLIESSANCIQTVLYIQLSKISIIYQTVVYATYSSSNKLHGLRFLQDHFHSVVSSIQCSYKNCQLPDSKWVLRYCVWCDLVPFIQSYYLPKQPNCAYCLSKLQKVFLVRVMIHFLPVIFWAKDSSRKNVKSR